MKWKNDAITGSKCGFFGEKINKMTAKKAVFAQFVGVISTKIGDIEWDLPGFDFIS